MEASVRITFEEAFFGVKKDISIKRRETCETCNGTGRKARNQKGQVLSLRWYGPDQPADTDAAGNEDDTQTCPTCSRNRNDYRNAV